MSEQVVLTPEESLTQLGDILIGNVLGSDDVSKFNRQTLFGQVTPKVFRNENFVLYSVLNNFKEKGITPDEAFIKMFLLSNKKFIKESQEFLDLNAYADLDEDPVIGYITAVIKQYVRLLGDTVPKLSTEDYPLTLEKYKTEFSSFEMSKTYSQSRIILYDGLQVGRKFYQGYTDSVAYVKKKIADIEAVLDHTTGDGFINSREMAIEEDNTESPDLIGDFDLVTELNKQLGGIYTSLFYNVMAPTKGGKSKFTSRLVHTMVVKFGTDVSVWAHEGGYKAWWAQLRAIHFEYMYIRNATDGNKVAPISQKDILYNNYPSPAIKALENASKLDLFTNPNYGNVYMIDRPFNAETFIDEIETSVQLNNSRAVLIDYLQLISSTDRGKSKPQYIGKAYQDLLAYCKKRNVAGISPSQFTQDFMNEMAKSKDGSQHEVRTAGGESSEIIRTPDINIALYATVEDLMRKTMTIMSVPSRLAEPFPDIPIYADLCSSVFSSMSNDEEGI